MPSILIVDDEQEILDLTKMGLELQGYEVLTAMDGEGALKLVRERHPQLLLIDYRLKGDMSGLELLKAARAINPTVPAVVITGLMDNVDSLKQECEQLGVTRFFQKPLQMEQVFSAVKDALKPAAPPT